MQFSKTENKAIKEIVLYGTHESGLRVYIIPKKGFSKYYAIYGTEYGSIDEMIKPTPDSEPTRLPDGIAHYLEHKLFEESDGKNAFDKFALTGASSNAFTSFDMTAYLFSCTDRFYENLEILLEFVNNPYFTEENVAKEQGIIGQEIKMYDDDPGWQLFFNSLGAMYHKNPVKTDIAGTVESISHITPELLYKCHETYYNPSNMRLVLVGDIDPERVVPYIDKYVDKSRDRGEVERIRPQEPKGVVTHRVSRRLSVSKPMFLIGFKEKTEGESGERLLRKQIVTKILTEILFGRSGGFFTELYGKGLIDATFEKDAELEKGYGFTSISGETKDPDEVYRLTLEYIERVKKDGLHAEDIARAKRIAIGKSLREYDSVEQTGNSFIRGFMNGFNLLDYRGIAESITADELTARLFEHFDGEYAVLSVIEPESAEK